MPPAWLWNIPTIGRIFLSTAAWNYKYPFQDQLLIYAQRPDATACASIDVWNKRLNRWVKRGAKGIALIEDRGNHFGLRHVFDISDTQSRDPRPVSLWRMEPGDIAVVTETLNNAFGEQEPDAAWPNALLSAARNAVDDNSSDYVDLLVRELEGSLLEDWNANLWKCYSVRLRIIPLPIWH